MRSNSEISILAVDDHTLNLELLRQDLGDAGYKIETARSGREALEAIARAIPDLVLLDIMMPEMSGLEVLKRIREGAITKDLPVILVTAKSQSRDVTEGLRKGANDYVVKPIDVDILLARVETQLRLRGLQRELEARNERIRRDLQEARRIQVSLLPTEESLDASARTYGLRLTGYNRAAEQLGGDFWDVVNLGDGSLGILVADFTGRGVIPALHTVRLKTLLHTACSSLCNVTLALMRLNAQLVRDLPRSDYATCVFLQYRTEDHSLRCANAGHPPPMIWRKIGGRAESLREGGNPLGLFAEAEFGESTLSLEKGDVVLLFTNGLLNLAGQDEDSLSAGRLRDLLQESAPAGISAVRDALIEHIHNQSAAAPLKDDLTFVVMEAVE